MEIVYTSILNKEAFEKHYEKLKNDLFDIWEHFEYQERKQCIDKEMLVIKDQTKMFFSINDKTIRIAFFDELLNSLYENNMIIFDLPQYFKLEKAFNTRMMDVNVYKAEPFKAEFSSSVFLSEDHNSYVVFNKHTKSLYFMIDNVNYLKLQFDRHKNDNHFTIDRLLPISKAILSKDPLNVIDKLQTSQLCSPSVDAKISSLSTNFDKKRIGMIKFAILTLGCKVNLYESENYIQSLKEEGFSEVSFNEHADIYIVNTCTVTNTASSKSRQKINQARKQNPNALICAVGCLVQIGDERFDQLADIDIKIGSSSKDQLVTLIKKALVDKKKHYLIEDVRQNIKFDELYVNNFAHHTRAFLKIQDGCDQFCTYCIIPYARGSERSLAPNKVIKQANNLLTNGHKELVLSGIHTGRYGKEYQTSLTDLIKQLLKTSVYRLRISSIEITEITDEMILLIKNDVRLAKHLHIPLQSGCDKILTLMKRPYDTAYYLERIRYIQQLIPDISISTDVIVGFPGETEEDFMKTFAFIKEVNFSFLHVFPYSKKNGTVAAQMPDQISKDIKRSRVNQLIALSNQLYEAYQKTFITKEVAIIMEAAKNGKWMGHSSHYLPVIIDSDEVYHNKVYNVSITSYENLHLLGKLVEV